MKIAFCTYVSDRFFDSMGARKLIASAKYFHPNIPFIHYGDKEINPLSISYGLLHPFMIDRAMKEGYDAIIYMDSDSMVVGPLNELLLAIEQDYHIIGVRNNNDYDKAGMDEPIVQQGAGVEQYLNAGLLAVKRNTNFLETWMDWNLLHGESCAFKEQTILNILARKYKTLIIDPKDSKVYYGVSGLYGEVTHWDSWMDIKVDGKDLVLNKKLVKIIHQAGGTRNDKMGFYMFNNETRKRLIEITGL